MFIPPPYHQRPPVPGPSMPMYQPTPHVPYQKCPVCDGAGYIINDSTSTSVTSTCPTCQGNRIIPMFPIKTNTMPILETVYTKADIRVEVSKKLCDNCSTVTAHNFYSSGMEECTKCGYRNTKS